MADLFATIPVPDDAAHWDALAQRVASNARTYSGSGFAWLAHSRTSWIAASLLLAAAVALVVRPPESSSAKRLSAEWVQALVPADDVGKEIVLHDTPPAIGALLLRAKDGG